MLFVGGALVLLLVAVAGTGRRSDQVPAAEPDRIRVPVIPARQPAPMRRVAQPPQPGLKEEAEARRRAEDRAQAAEQRLLLLQEQYRTTLEELHASQRAMRDRPVGEDRALEERAVKAEAASRSLEQRLHSVTAERDRIAGELLARRDAVAGAGQDRLEQAEAEAMGLRAELEGAQTQLSLTMQELSAITRQAERSTELQEELDAAQLESLHAKDAVAAMDTELRSARTELEDARAEMRALRSEEQRATMLTDELRTAKAELESLRASHRAELVEQEADLEEKVRSVREEFQAQLAEAEERHAADLEVARREAADLRAAADVGAREATERVAAVGADLEAARSESEARAVDLESARAELQGAHDRIAELQREFTEREVASRRIDQEAEESRSEIDALTTELDETRTALEAAEAALASERSDREELQNSSIRARSELEQVEGRAERLAAELEEATEANADLNRRLQEIESRRALEMAEDEGRARMDELLSATQERLAGQSEKLIAAEERNRELERQTALDAERLEDLEAKLRQHQMADQIRELQPTRHDHHEPAVEGPAEDRRGAAPFVREMSLDAQKTLSRIMGVIQLLKHKREAKDHGQLVQQLAGHARRLDATIRDLSDVDSLVTGDVELELRNTDLESLIRRVVDESGVEADHDVRVEVEPTSITIDRTRTEQIVSGLLRSATERTPTGKTIGVRLLRDRGGALIVVEDADPSSAAAPSPMVRRLAEVQGGWAKVEPREGGGGTAFRVFLPHGGPDGAPSDDEFVEPAEVSTPEDAVEQDPNHWVKAEQALVRELRELSQGKSKR
jgi:chromosome segregation ATPase